MANNYFHHFAYGVFPFGFDLYFTNVSITTFITLLTAFLLSISTRFLTALTSPLIMVFTLSFFSTYTSLFI